MMRKIFAFAAVFVAATALLALTAQGMLDGSPAVTTMAQSQLTVGDRHAAAGSLGSAVAAYRVAVELMRADGRLPVQELRRVANAQFFAGDYLSAARTLEQLAEDAAAHNDLTAQFWAFADAAYLARLGGSDAYARWQMQRAERLLASPALPEETRAELEQKVTAPELRVFAPHLSSW